MNPASATAFTRLQVAMWLEDGTCCQHCGKPYTSVDDFIARNPRLGLGWQQPYQSPNFTDHFVDEECWVDHVRWNEAS